MMTSVISQPMIGEDSPNSGPSGFCWFLMAPLLVCLAIVLLARDPTVFLFPALRVEDGKDIFAYFYSHAEPHEMLRFKAGYIPLLPNIIGYGLLLLPTRWIPYGFVAVPFLFSLLTYSLFFAPVYRYYIKSDVIRATICILFPLAPFFHYDIHFSVDYIIWNALLLLSLILMLPAPHGWMNLPWLLLISILLFSNPLTIVLNGRFWTDANQAPLLCLPVLSFYFLLNVAMGYYGFGRGFDRPVGWYSSDLKNGLITAQFFSRLADAEKSLCAGENLLEQVAKQPMLASKGNGDWPFEVFPKCRHSEL